MECLDASVVVKWFKANEQYTNEAYALYSRAKKNGSRYVVNEWLILEVVRGLAKTSVPKENLKETYSILKHMYASDIIRLVTVSEVLESAKDLEIELNLHAADAVHLATAIRTGSAILWTEDEHLHKKSVLEYAGKRGVEIRRLKSETTL